MPTFLACDGGAGSFSTSWCIGNSFSDSLVDAIFPFGDACGRFCMMMLLDPIGRHCKAEAVVVQEDNSSSNDDRRVFLLTIIPLLLLPFIMLSTVCSRLNQNAVLSAHTLKK